MKKIGLSLAVLGLVGLAACGNPTSRNPARASRLPRPRPTRRPARLATAVVRRRAPRVRRRLRQLRLIPVGRDQSGPAGRRHAGLPGLLHLLVANGSPADIQTALEQHQLANIDVTDVSGKNVTSNYGKGNGRLSGPYLHGQRHATRRRTVTYQVIDENTVRSLRCQATSKTSAGDGSCLGPGPSRCLHAPPHDHEGADAKCSC